MGGDRYQGGGGAIATFFIIWIAASLVTLGLMVLAVFAIVHG